MEFDLKQFTDKASINTDWKLIIRIDQERVLFFVHFREQNEVAVQTWKGLQMELKNQIKEICVKVNRNLLLHDLNDSRLCNRLLEPETNEDAWRDVTRQNSIDYEEPDEAPYLEANMNMRWAPGKFQCPEVWKTTFSLHPRLKQGQGHGSQSWGMQAIRTILLHNIVTNRADMFVYMDDNKNIFYIKISEQMFSNYTHNILSRQTSMIAKEEEAFSRTSSVGSSKQLRRSMDQKDEHASTTTSRSNSVGEADKAKNDDQIIFRVFGIEEVGKNIKEDLTAVLQKKLDDKVVEVISMMLKRNSRCKLASEDVIFLQKPNSSPTTTLRFRVHLNAMPYLLAIVFYLKQNLVQIPLMLQPNYMAGNTRRFRDIGLTDELSPNMHGCDSDIFIYNDHNEKGGRNGIACLALSLVDGKGNLVRHCSHPKPVSSDCPNPPDLSDLEEIIQTDLYSEDEGAKSPGPGPMALVQFRIWETGRVDMGKLSCLLETAIKHSMWDAVLEFKLLPQPLCVSTEDESDDDFKNNSSVEVTSPTAVVEDLNKSKLSLKSLSEEAVVAYGYQSVRPTVPQILVECREASELIEVERKEVILTEYDLGNKGVVSKVYQESLCSWYEVGRELEVPSYYYHEVDLVSKHEIKILVKEISSLIQGTVSDLNVKLFHKVRNDGTKECLKPTDLSSVSGSSADEYLILGRNVRVWKHIVAEEHDLTFLKKSFSKHLQNFPSLVQSVHAADTQSCFSPLFPGKKIKMKEMKLIQPCRNKLKIFCS